MMLTQDLDLYTPNSDYGTLGVSRLGVRDWYFFNFYCGVK